MTENSMTLPLRGTLIRCGLVGLLCGMPFLAYMLIFVLLFLAVGLVRSIYVAWKKPERRRLEKWKAGMWVLTVGCIVLIHVYYYYSARGAADTVLAAVLSYEQEHGAYPENVEAAGLEKTRSAWWLSYSLQDGKPRLFYLATFIVYDSYQYDFERQSWVYVPD